MKKLTISLWAFSFALMISAEPIGRQAALYTAKSYMLAKGKSLNEVPASSRSKASSSSSSGETDENSPYYVFNAGDDGGYVIVSGDDRVEPILGYVDQGSFDPDNIPENMRYMLEGIKEEIQYIIDNNLQPESPQLKRRSKVASTKHSVPELLTTRWNQGLPYNLTLPYYYKEDGSQARPATGCIATAWAQVVAFHRYPEKIKANIPSYSKTYKLDDGTEKTVTYPVISRGTTIDWDNIRDTYSCNESHAHTAQDTAVADLMRYCGYAVKMSYGGSSGASYHLADFVKYFGFDDGAYRISRDNYDIDGWVDAIYEELAEGYPMPMAGTKIGGAHAFVVDGFDGDNLFHVNWGWGGTGNGWFILGVLNRWNRGNGALMHLRRPDNVRAEPRESLSVSDVAVSGTNIKATFTNKTGDTGSFSAGIVKLEEDGTYTLVGTRQTISGMADKASQSKTFQILKKLPEGTYKLSPASKLSAGKVWYPSYNMRDEYIEAVVDADSVPTMRVIKRVTDICIDTVVVASPRIVGQEQTLKVSFRNSGDEFYHDVHLFASKTQTKVYTEYLYRVDAHKGETVTYPFYFTPQETGTYNLWFCTNKDGSGEIGRGTLEIVEEADAEKADLSVSFSLTNGTTSDDKNFVAYGRRLIGKATIKNNASKDFHGSVKLELWHQKKSGGSAVSGPSKSYNLDIPKGKSVEVNYEFDDLSYEFNYRFKTEYGNQSGTLTNGGVFTFKFDMQEGFLTWKGNGTVAGQAYRASQTVASTTCGFYADCNNFTRLNPNRNPNTIYAFASGMEVPSSLDTCNAVSGKHATHIRLVGDKAFYNPVNFEADSASFTYTFPETEEGTGWHAFTLPFRADSIFVDNVPVSLDDEGKHFWIYEFAAQGDNGEVIFAPATVLRGSTPYIIAADATMAGRSVVFRSLGVSFYKTGSDKMLVSSPGYKFCGTTLSPIMKDCYVLNAEGTAFEYVTKNTTLTGLTSYFITSLSEELRLPSIVLPEVPKAPSEKTGDLNGDAKVDIADAVSVLNIMAEGNYSEMADINNDEKVDIADFVSILNIMAEQ